MKKLAAIAVLALLGFGAGALTTGSSPMFSRPRAQAGAGQARLVPLMALFDNGSANPDGSGVYSVTYLIAVRKDGLRAWISTSRFGKGWLKTRVVYDPSTKQRVDIHDDLGIKTTWPGQPTDVKGAIATACPQIVDGQTVQVLGHSAVQNLHKVDTGGGELTVIDGWRIPELGCLRALTTFRHRSNDDSYVRNGEDRLVWLSETDPPESYFGVSPGLEEVSPSEAFQRYVRAGLWSDSEPAPSGTEQSDVSYAFWNGRVDRAQAMARIREMETNQVPAQP